MKQHLVRFMCDTCGNEEDFNLSIPFTPQQRKRIAGWITTITENGTKTGEEKNYCRPLCGLQGMERTLDTIEKDFKQGEPQQFSQTRTVELAEVKQ